MITRKAQALTSVFSPTSRVFVLNKNGQDMTLTKVEAWSFCRFVVSIGSNYLLRGLEYESKSKKN